MDNTAINRDQYELMRRIENSSLGWTKGLADGWLSTDESLKVRALKRNGLVERDFISGRWTLTLDGMSAMRKFEAVALKGGA